MSARSGGAKRRKSTPKCPGCGAAVAAYGTPCAACAPALKTPGDARCPKCGGLLGNFARAGCTDPNAHAHGMPTRKGA